LVCFSDPSAEALCCCSCSLDKVFTGTKV
jgi:hypothetical protein